MVFDVVFANEVGDGSWVVDGRITTTVDGRIYEDLHIVVEGCIDKCFALSFFRVLLEEAWNGCLCLTV